MAESSTKEFRPLLHLSKFIRSLTFRQVIGYLIAILILRFFLRAIQRIWFHPLSKYPGPKIRAATRIPGHIDTWLGRRHHVLTELHRKYGPVVRVHHDELSFTDANAWKDIYGHGTKSTPGSNPHKAWNKYGKSANNTTNLIQARDADHNRQRKIFTSAFSDRALKQQEPLFTKYVDLLISKLKEGIDQDPETKYDMVKMYNFTTFDVMGDLTFGEPLHMLDNAEYDPWVSIIFDTIKLSAQMSILSNYPAVSSLIKKMMPASVNKKRKDHFAHSVARVTKRLEKGRSTEGVDLWDLVLGQKEGKGLSRGEMDSNASLFMIAGTETTATLVSGLTWLLLRNPDKMNKLVTEIREKIIAADEMHMEQLAALPYLNACIKEAFRMYPPVPHGLPRITPADGSTLCGQFVPPNTTVTIPQYSMYRDERNFSMPNEYIPERWLGYEKFDSDEKHSLQPFSVGSRDCVGKNMAYHEMRLIMAKVLYSFDFELAPQSQNWGDQETFILWQKRPLMCKLRVATV